MNCKVALLCRIPFPLRFVGPLFFAFWWFNPANAAAPPPLSVQFAELTQAYYQEAAAELRGTVFIESDMQALQRRVAKLIGAEDKTLAIAVIVANLNSILDNINSEHSVYFLSLLLEQEVRASADKFIDAATAFGDAFTLSNLHYQFARYHFERGESTATLQHLTSIDSGDALSIDERDYATIMFGITLQKQKKHREALEIYQRIAPESRYFSYAQLNIAVANIRQGWWTDAHLAIERALAESVPAPLKETTNRLLLVLAYSQLQNEFYRKARQTFRKLNLDSQYVDRALLGIGLCALNLKDYGGALNIFNRLQQSDSDALPVLESYLLIPFTYERMGAIDEASLLYSQAIAFYENKIRALQQQRSTLLRASSPTLRSEWTTELPGSQTQIYRALQHLDGSHSSANVARKIREMRTLVEQQIVEELANRTQQKIDTVRSYMSQSQYGLAKLYDSQ